MYVCVHVNMYTSMSVEVIIELIGVSSFSIMWVLGMDLRSSSWQQAPFSTEPTYWPLNMNIAY